MASFLGIARALFLSLLASAAVVNGACTNPKVRREWRQLSTQERGDWISAVNCLATFPHDPSLTPSVATNLSLIPPVNQSSTFYDDIVYQHMDLNYVIHFTGLFFPWHRYYVQFFEDSLTNKCGYKGASPYWDWSLDAPDFYNATIWDDSPFGVGGWGDPANDFQINTGGFKDVIRAYPIPHHIRRNYTLYPFDNPSASPFGSNGPVPPTNFMINTTMTKGNVNYTVNGFEGDFIDLQAYTEGLTVGTHPGAHLIVNGDMIGNCPNGTPNCHPGPKWTPNDPLFFMHHAMIDKIWYDWQNKCPENKYSYGGGSLTAISNFTTFTSFPTGLPPFLNFDSEIPGDGFWNDIRIWDVMDTTGDTLCYVYA